MNKEKQLRDTGWFCITVCGFVYLAMLHLTMFLVANLTTLTFVFNCIIFYKPAWKITVRRYSKQLNQSIHQEGGKARRPAFSGFLGLLPWKTPTVSNAITSTLVSLNQPMLIQPDERASQGTWEACQPCLRQRKEDGFPTTASATKWNQIIFYTPTI